MLSRFSLLASRVKLSTTTPPSSLLTNPLISKTISSVTGLANFAAKYARIGVEFARLVGKGADISFPNASQFVKLQSDFALFTQSLQNGAWRKVTVNELYGYSVAGATVVGFFLVGEIIGRRNLVGYKIPGAEVHGHGH